jgi:hypothetical protein
MKTIIGILTKSPHPQGRVGPREKQDWYRQCVDVVELHRKIPESEIVVTSALHIKGARREEEYYTEAILSLGDSVIALEKGVETIEQIRVFKEYISVHEAKLILSVTFTHFLRVVWLCFRAQLTVTKYKVSWGIPRPKEFVTDIILTFLYPILDILGKGTWFMEKVQARRKEGNF